MHFVVSHGSLSTLAVVHPISWFQAVVLGLLQGITELFPVSSLGHTVLFSSLFGWDTLVRFQSRPESPWLAFVVTLHVSSAIGLLIYFWRDWVTIMAFGAWTPSSSARRESWAWLSPRV